LKRATVAHHRPCHPHHSPSEQRRLGVLNAVIFKAVVPSVPAALLRPAFHLEREHPIHPREVQHPLALAVESVLTPGRRQFRGADVQRHQLFDL